MTAVHKANVLSLTTGLFRDVCREVGARYPSVTVDDEHVDAGLLDRVRDVREPSARADLLDGGERIGLRLDPLRQRVSHATALRFSR